MTRTWTQKRIEELIKSVADAEGLSGGDGYHLSQTQRLQSLVGSVIFYKLGAQTQTQLRANCQSYKKDRFTETLVWRFTLDVINGSPIPPNKGDTCFAVLEESTHLGNPQLHLSPRLNNDIFATIDIGPVRELRLELAFGETQMRVGGGTTRPLLTVLDGGVGDWRYADTNIPVGSYVAYWTVEEKYII